LDGDGDGDVVAANFGADKISILLNHGDGTFSAYVQYGVGNGPLGIVIGDLDGHGSDDIAVANQNEDSLSVLLSTCLLPLSPADLDGDGVVNGFDLALLLGMWGVCPKAGACPADLNGDGTVNGFDLAILLGSWG
jgi:hypothetical protein